MRKPRHTELKQLSQGHKPTNAEIGIKTYAVSSKFCVHNHYGKQPLHLLPSSENIVNFSLNLKIRI